MRILSILKLSVSLTPVLLVACSGAAGSGSSTDTKQSSLGTEAPPLPRMMPPHPLGRLLYALDSVELRDDQIESVNRARADLDPPSGGPPMAVRSFHEKLARAVKQGKVEPKNFENEISALERDANDHEAKVLIALDELHATLDASQRKELVAALDKGEGPHLRPPRAPDGPPPPPFVRELDLSAEQRDALREKLGDPPPPPRDPSAAKQALASFANDDFDANTALASLRPADGPRQHATRLVKLAAAMCDVLTDEQRVRFAAAIERGPRKPD